MRWDIIGLSGLALAAVGIGVTIWLNDRNERLAFTAACNEASLAVSQIREIDSAASAELTELEERMKTAESRLESTKARTVRARRYFDALEGERLASRVRSQFDAALREVDQEYGASAFEIMTADDWVDALDDAGYPRALAERQLIARQLLRFDLEDGADNALVLSIRDRNLTERLVKELAQVGANAATARDRFYHPQFQGVLEVRGFIETLISDMARAQTERDTAERNLEVSRSQLRRSESQLRGAVARYEALDCEKSMSSS